MPTPHGHSPWSAAGQAAGATFDAGSEPTITPEPPAPSRNRSKVAVGAAVVGVLAVGAGGLFAAANLAGGSAGGAANPDELGLELLGAFEDEDVLGALDTFLPAERAVLQDPLVELGSELTRLEVLSPDADLASVAGIDVELSGESVTAEATNVVDIVNVRMEADATVTVDGAELPLGDLIADRLDADDLAELRATSETDSDHLDFELTAVEHDGRWYFSAFYSIAEQVRSEIEPSPDIPAEGIGAVGADSPDAAFDQLLDAIEGFDARALIQLLNPGEAAAMQRYAPLFLDDAEAAVDEAMGGSSFTWAITDRQFRVLGGGDARTVVLDGLTIEIEEAGDRYRFSFEGDCFTVDLAGEVTEQCAGDAAGALDELRDELGEALPTVQALVETIEAAFADLEPIGLEVREHDGAWYVSPVGSLTEGGLKILRALDRDEVDAIVEAGTAVAVELETTFDGFDDLLGDLVYGSVYGSDVFEIDPSVEPAIDWSSDDDWSDEPTYEPTSEDDWSSDDWSSDDWPSDDWSGGWSGGEETAVLGSDCWMLADAGDAAACFQGAVDEGMDPLEVPVVLRHPECGYDVVGWERGDGLTDAEFLAAAAAATDCFRALVASGGVAEWELPYEITHPDCFEGRNWYREYGDPEYDDRFFDCVTQPAFGLDG